MREDIVQAMIISVNMGNILTATGRLIHKHITTYRCVCQEFVYDPIKAVACFMFEDCIIVYHVNGIQCIIIARTFQLFQFSANWQLADCLKHIPFVDGFLSYFDALLLLFWSHCKRFPSVERWGICFLDVDCRNKALLVTKLNLPPILQIQSDLNLCMTDKSWFLAEHDKK